MDFFYLDLSDFVNDRCSFLMNMRSALVKLCLEKGFTTQARVQQLMLLESEAMSCITSCVKEISTWAKRHESCMFIIWDEIQCWSAQAGPNQLKACLNSPEQYNLFHVFTGSGMAAYWKSMQDANKHGNDWFLSVSIINMPLRSSRACLDLVEAKCREKFVKITDEEARALRAAAPPVAPGLVYYYYKCQDGADEEAVRRFLFLSYIFDILYIII
jgi:hypothetical protein